MKKQSNPLVEVVVINVTPVTYACQELLGVPYRQPIIWIKPRGEDGTQEVR